MHCASAPEPDVLRRSLRRITVAGCLAMIYVTGTSSPAATDFFRAIGLNEFHFGLLSGIPLIMLCMQFVGALMAGRLRTRKTPFLVLTILSRLLYVPIALLPLLFPAMRTQAMVITTILLMALSQAMSNFIGPIWFSWMGDLIPTSLLNRFWSRRYRWMQLTWTLAYLGVAAFTYYAGLPIQKVYAVCVIAGCVAGVMDILLFLRVHEPANPEVKGESIRSVLLAPLQHKDYRTFVAFSCFWALAVNFFAPFTQLFALKLLGLTPWAITLMWCLYGVASVLTAKFWGEIADRYGNRPVMTSIIWGKSLVVIAFLVVTPGSAWWILSGTFFFDGMLNAGYAIASNSYMFKIAPPDNRSMYVAAITGLAGICGGAGAMIAGALLQWLTPVHVELLGRTWTNYHLLFALSVVLRWMGILLAHRIREPQSSRTLDVVASLLDLLPAQFLQYPMGWYRRLLGTEDAGKKR